MHLVCPNLPLWIGSGAHCNALNRDCHRLVSGIMIWMLCPPNTPSYRQPATELAKPSRKQLVRKISPQIFSSHPKVYKKSSIKHNINTKKVKIRIFHCSIASRLVRDKIRTYNLNIFRVPLYQVELLGL